MTKAKAPAKVRTGREPLRTYRASDEVYLPAQRRAAKEGTSLSEVIREALTEYAKNTRGTEK